MNRIVLLYSLLILQYISFAQTIKSPDGTLSLTFALNAEGEPTYQLKHGLMEVVKTSKLGILLTDGPSFDKSFSLASIDTSSHDETWETVWGEVRYIRDRYRELTVTLKQPSVKSRTIILRFRLFNDGLGFRYEFPKQEHLSYFTVSNELTEFTLTGDHKTFWIPGDYDTNEYAYTTSLLSKIDATTGNAADEIFAKTPISRNAVQTPLMMKTGDGLYLNIHEAALVDYPAMNLILNQQTFSLMTHLVPDAVGNKAYLQTPAKTPWRTIIVCDNAPDILNSKLILNLNEPTKLEDVRWIKPQKYVGVWWELHIAKSSWNYADVDNVNLAGTDWSTLKPNGRHGATTARVKRYIDFAAEHGIDGVLVEGWNIGWEDWFGNWKEEVFDFITPYPDFDVKELQRYAAQKGVKLIMHHETSASVTNYERRMAEAYRFMKDHGYDAVKTGYVGKIIPRGEHHDGQWMVNHYVRVAELTAQHQIMVVAHEPVRPTGLHRTYPNWLASEAARGNEFNAWSHGNPPEHETILPFTRLIGGPMDYTPGIFQIKIASYGRQGDFQVHTTLAKQLALYVTMYSPIQMAADLPENYERFPDAFQFIKDVAVDWDDTKILEAEPGDFLTIARKARSKDEWYIGAITDEHPRSSQIVLDFLPKKRWYLATIYADGPNAHWKKKPMEYQIQNALVNDQTKLNVKLAPGGGTAISLRPATPEDLTKWKKY
ncbi:MAG: glycoside hydrolase family 97 protein [Ignavibacteria bacterium]|nr:glycoside hydrolase family 97 protein [Ignavibacteria bacterium]